MQLKVNDILQCMRDRCKDELTPITTTSIYEEELVKLRNHEWNDDIHQLVANIPTFQSCKGQLYNQRQKLHPTLPTTVADIDLNGEWTETTTREPFLLADTNTYGRLLVFGTQDYPDPLSSS